MTNEDISVWRIGKLTGTHGDVFAAVGLGDLLSGLVTPEGIRLRDEGAAGYAVETSEPIGRAGIDSLPHTPGYPFLKTKGKVAPRDVQDSVDYAAEKAKADRRKKAAEDARKKPRKGKNKPVVDYNLAVDAQDDQPRDDWRLLQVLNTLQGDETTNRVHAQIVAMGSEQFTQAVTEGLTALAVGRLSTLDLGATTVQLFTPPAAKGYARLKPDGTDRNDKTKEGWADPFIEWLRYRGYFNAACPFFQGSKAEHIRVICPVPRNVSLGALCAAVRELRRSPLYGTAPKLDSLAALTLAQILIRHSEEFHDDKSEPFAGLRLADASPASVIGGLTVTHYQSMGNAKAVSSILTIALPGWFPIKNPQDAMDWLEILDEHRRIVVGLQDNHSDEIGLLIAYRQFLQSHGQSAAESLLEFVGSYGRLIMHANGSRAEGRQRWLRRFGESGLRRTLMGLTEGLAGISEDAGFQAVARAVRQSTVTAQNKRARGQEVWREIRYDLLHEIHRTRKVPGHRFVECISEFLSRYNQENARQREMTKNPKIAPANVSDDELRSFLGLVDKHGASLVGALVAAFGTCKEEWEADVHEAGSSVSASTSPTA